MASTGVILDTDVVVDFLRGFGEGVAAVRALLHDGQALVTVVTAYELLAGVRSERGRSQVQRFCAHRTLPLGLGASRRAAEVGRRLRAAGTPIGAADTLIAGICLFHGCRLATRNTRHFSRVPDLALHPLA